MDSSSAQRIIYFPGSPEQEHSIKAIILWGKKIQILTYRYTYSKNNLMVILKRVREAGRRTGKWRIKLKLTH